MGNDKFQKNEGQMTDKHMERHLKHSVVKKTLFQHLVRVANVRKTSSTIFQEDEPEKEILFIIPVHQWITSSSTII